jgi:excisionase family DNA binding protein
MRSAREHTEQKPEEDTRRLLPVSEVAGITGLSKWTILRRIHSGEWPSGRSGRKYLIPRSFVDGLVAEIEGGRQVVAEGYAATTWPAKPAEGAA